MEKIGKCIKNSDTRGGFTVIELLVAVSLFITFVTITVSLFNNVLITQRRLAKKMELTSSLGIVMEQIQREMRTGYGFSAMGVSNNPTNPISFTSLATSPNSTVVFGLKGGAIVRASVVDLSDSVTLTPSNVKIKALSFEVSAYKPTCLPSHPDCLKCSPWKINIHVVADPVGYEDGTDTVVAESVVVSRILPKDVKNDPYGCL